MDEIEKVINQLEEYIWEDNNWSELSNIRDKLKRFIQEYKQLKMNNESLQLQYDALLDSKEIDYKEAEDALCVLLHCSLKDTEYDTQKAQFGTVLSYIEKLEKRIKVLEQRYKLKVQQMVGYRDKNYISKSVIRDKIEELEKYEKLAKEQIENRIVIADSDSLNYGRAEAHSKDIQILKEILGDE